MIDSYSVFHSIHIHSFLRITKKQNNPPTPTFQRALPPITSAALHVDSIFTQDLTD